MAEPETTPAVAVPEPQRVAPVPPGAASRAATRPLPSGALWGIAALVVVAVVASWLDARRSSADLRTEVAQRLATIEAAGIAAGRGQAVTAAELRDAQAKIALLEERLAESQTQQSALEALYRDLAPSRDEIALTEVEQVLLIASQQLQLAGNVPAALAALQLADAKLQRLERPQTLALRRALTRDIDALKATPYVDVAGLSLKLDQAIAGVDALTLARDERIPPPPRESAPGADEPAWRRLLRDAWADLRQLVRIEVRTGRQRRRAAGASLLPAREPEAAPAVGADRAPEPRRRQLSRRRHRGRELGEAVFRPADQARADAAVDAEAGRRRADAGRRARPLAQPRRAAHAPARPGARGGTRTGEVADRAVRILFWFLLLAAAAVGVALTMKISTGYALFVAPPYRVEISLNLLLVSLVAGFVALYIVLRIVRRAMGLPDEVRAARRRTQQERARAKNDAAVVALLEGRYGRSRKFADESLAIPQSSGLAALVGARAAIETRDFAAAEALLRAPTPRSPRWRCPG